MPDQFVSRGFVGKRRGGDKQDRLPPGQYITDDFPVLSAGPTPHTPLEKWTFSMEGLVKQSKSWSWSEFLELPMQSFTVDIS
jgi:DMSO/TMAO reductase YedYZ molybdopterin-dependent catalytic subunit